MATSQNGFSVLLKAPPPVKIQGTNISLRIRPGDVAVVLGDLASRFHILVEPLTLPGLADEWAWAIRPVRGKTTGYSNHASGTAIDLNATRHPRGVKGTFTDQKRRRVRGILSDYHDHPSGRKSIVRWGEDYQNSPVDGMHFEIVADADAVKRVADRIRAKYAEDTMPTSSEIALAVLNADVIVNKNAPKDSRNPTWSLSSMVSNIEDTQDQHTEAIKALSAKLDQLIHLVTPKKAPAAVPTPRADS